MNFSSGMPKFQGAHGGKHHRVEHRNAGPHQFNPERLGHHHHPHHHHRHHHHPQNTEALGAPGGCSCNA